MMRTEIEYAVTFIADIVREKLVNASQERIDTLKETLTTVLNERFQGHWYPDKPMKGSAYRCLNICVDENSVDQVLDQTFSDSGFTLEDLLNVFDRGLDLWVDPNDVCCRLGSKGAIFPIYRKIAERPVPKTSEHSLGVRKQRPQQRPRSITPPHQQAVSGGSQYQRSRSTTPPGFSSLDAGQMFQNLPVTSRSSLSEENLHKLWNTIPNTTSYNATSYHTPASYTSTRTVTNDAFSFNQYSSYYKPSNSYWKKNPQTRKMNQKPMWQSDDIYQKYHWSKSESLAAPPKSFVAPDLPSYSSFVPSRQVQEVY